MFYSALHIPTGKIIEIFDSSKHTEEEFKKFKSKYPAFKSYSIASKKDISDL